MPISLANIPGSHHVEAEHTGCAANATASRIALVVPFDCTLSGIVFIPTAAMAHSATNYAILDVQVDGSSILDAPFTFDDAYGDLDKGELLTLDTEDTALSAGDVVFVEITQNASGLLVPIFVTDAIFLAA